MSLMVWLTIGAAIGWLGSLVPRSGRADGAFMNVVVGIVGALIGGWLVGPLVGAAPAPRGVPSTGGIVVSLVGAVLLLALFNLGRRRRLR